MKQIFPNTVSKLIFGLAVMIMVSLQQQFWFGESGFLAHQQLRKAIAQQEKNNQELAEKNRVLAAEVDDLKNGIEALEEHARLELGLIKPNETFVQMSTINTQYQPIVIQPKNNTTQASDDVPPTIEP